MITKEELDKLVIKYETKDFIKDDPIQFPHRFKNREDIALAGFITSLFSYGNRKMFIKKLNELFEIMGNEPVNFIRNNEFDLIKEKNFNYRFSKPNDIEELLNILYLIEKEFDGISNLFETMYQNANNLQQMQQDVIDYFYENVSQDLGQGFYHLLPNPFKGGAMKRMNMYLRWMVRKSEVDLGIWNFIKPSELLIPLDVHVARLSREMELLTKKGNNIKAVIEITNNLKKYDPIDPIKYDFAMFGKGIEETYG